MAAAFNKEPANIFRTSAWKEYEAALIEEKKLKSVDLQTSKTGDPDRTFHWKSFEIDEIYSKLE